MTSQTKCYFSSKTLINIVTLFDVFSDCRCSECKKTEREPAHKAVVLCLCERQQGNYLANNNVDAMFYIPLSGFCLCVAQKNERQKAKNKRKLKVNEND